MVLLHYIECLVATLLLQDDCETRKDVKNTVNSEILARFLFSQNFTYHAKFCENDNLAKCQNQSVIN